MITIVEDDSKGGRFIYNFQRSPTSKKLQGGLEALWQKRLIQESITSIFIAFCILFLFIRTPKTSKQGNLSTVARIPTTAVESW